MVKQIDVFEYAPYILSQLRRGMLVNVKADDRINTMTIGWGTQGIEWNLPVFVIYIRDSRYTYKLLENTDCFTISIPAENSDPKETAKILSLCGTRSGRDTDKFSLCGLDPVDGLQVSSPAIKQLPITIECRIIARQPQNPKGLPQKLQQTFYPSDDPHTAFYGQIVNAYILEDK